MARTVSATSRGRVLSGQVGKPVEDLGGAGEFVRSSAQPPATAISTTSATSANLRDVIGSDVEDLDRSGIRGRQGELHTGHLEYAQRRADLFVLSGRGHQLQCDRLPPA